MSLIREQSSRQSVFADAMSAVMAVGRDGAILDVNSEAQRLMQHHQNGPVSLEEITAFIMRFAVREHVTIMAG